MSFSRAQELRQLLRLAMPLLGAQVLATAMSAVDTLMSGHYSAKDLAAIAVGSSFWLPMTIFLNGLLIATTTMIARSVGRGDSSHVISVLRNSLWLSIPLAVFMGLALANSDFLIRLVAQNAGFTAIASRYLDAVAWGMPALAVSGCLRALYEGVGNTRPYMVSAIGAFVLNIPLNYLFIFGAGPLPALGGEGCGWATAISWWAQTLLLVALSRSQGGVLTRYQPVSPLNPSVTVIGKILTLGLPIALAVFAEVTIFSTIALMLAPLGASVVAAHQVALTTSHLIFMVPLSLAQAITIRVGHYLGADQPSQANAVIRLGLQTGIVLGVVSGGALLLGRDAIIGLFGVTPGIHDLARTLFWWMALYQISDQIQVLSNAALRGYQDTRTPMVLVLCCYWLLALPLGYVLGRTDWLLPAMAAEGFWIGLLVGLSASAMMLTLRLRRLMKQVI